MMTLSFFYLGGYVTCVTIITSFVASTPVHVYTRVCNNVCVYSGLNNHVRVSNSVNTRRLVEKKVDLRSFYAIENQTYDWSGS